MFYCPLWSHFCQGIQWPIRIDVGNGNNNNERQIFFSIWSQAINEPILRNNHECLGCKSYTVHRIPREPELLNKIECMCAQLMSVKRQKDHNSSAKNHSPIYKWSSNKPRNTSITSDRNIDVFMHRPGKFAQTITRGLFFFGARFGCSCVDCPRFYVRIAVRSRWANNGQLVWMLCVCEWRDQSIA